MATAPFQLLEASWEVCNKVGGIFTVVTSKVRQAQKQCPGRYLAIGPNVGQSAAQGFREESLPASLSGVVDMLRNQGITVRYGTWLIDTEAPVVLLGWDGLVSQINSLKALLWEDYRLDTLGTNFYDVDQPLLWGIAVGRFAEAFATTYDGPVMLQAHEWLAAGALLVPKDRPKNLKTTFTTHATVLGRALSGTGNSIYDRLQEINPDDEARKHGVTAKHQLEKLAALQANVFTTVSHLTAEEATAFLGKAPDVVTENGLDTEQFPAFDALCAFKVAMRDKLDDFVSAYFFPSYSFDLEKTNYQFTMGRYEVHNKGYDTYLEALGKLNQQLKDSGSDKTVVSFFLIPGDCLRLKPEVASQMLIYRQIKDYLAALGPRYQRRVYGELVSGAVGNDELPKAVTERIRHLMSRFNRPAAPAISPYDVRQGDNDEVIRIAKENGLLNRPEDRVKLLFFPVYLDGLDGIFNAPLYDIVAGFDLGVFPSIYEPWGYTPMEALVMGVPAVTSTLAGFGRTLAHSPATAPAGIFVLDRRAGSTDDQRTRLLNLLAGSIEENSRSWMLRRMSAYLSIQAFSWTRLYANYAKAYRLAWKKSS